MAVYVTPYNKQTKDATAPSAELPFPSLELAVEAFAVGLDPIRSSRRLALFTAADGSGLAFSDYRIR